MKQLLDAVFGPDPPRRLDQPGRATDIGLGCAMVRSDHAQVLAAEMAGESAAGLARVGMEDPHVRMTGRDLAELASVDDVIARWCVVDEGHCTGVSLVAERP